MYARVGEGGGLGCEDRLTSFIGVLKTAVLLPIGPASRAETAHQVGWAPGVPLR